MTTDTTRITERLAELTTQRSQIPDEGQLPVSTTRDEAAALAERRITLDRRIAAIRTAAAAWAALGSADADAQWKDQLTAWRKILADELLALRPSIRDARAQGVAKNLVLSIRAIDFGVQVFIDSGWELENSKLGGLMMEAGYVITGADPSRNFVGTLVWSGSLRETEQRIATLAQRRVAASHTLAAALLDDAARATQEAEATARRDAFNAMHIKHRPDGEGLVAYTKTGDVLNVEDMTPLQREAFEQQDAVYRRDGRRIEVTTDEPTTPM